MKKKLSISIEEQTIDNLDSYLSDGFFRNKSHIIEFAINKFMKEKENASS
jgi:Arc/MetJ-type ribon-helix-helix transcriptional regulator